VKFQYKGKERSEYGPVILATGGYAADFTSSSLLKKHRPELWDLPTTNGDHCTGDGIKMTMDIGGNTIHMDKVQVHPTGLVDPKEPGAKVKFLAAEALRGVGGMLLDSNGNRFADELGHRDYVTGQMWKNKGPYRLVLNSKAGKEIEWHCKHYMARGLMKHYKSAAEMCQDTGMPLRNVEATFSSYNDIGNKKKPDPFGKKFFKNLPFVAEDSFWVAVVTPVLHFTMGGIQINGHSQVLSPSGPVSGLYACGEMAGGVHGANRLGGSSLLGCVVYGRVAGNTASNFLLAKLSAERRLGAVAGHVGGGQPISISVGGVNVAISYGSGPAPSLPASAPVEAEEEEEKKAAPTKQGTFTLADVAKHNTENDCWVVVDGRVLDCTNFLADHPGGKKAIMIYAGRDATEEFLMMHKLEVIDRHAPETVVGVLKD